MLIELKWTKPLLKKAAALSLCTITFLAVPVFGADSGIYKTIDRVNFREEPSTGSPSMGILPAGTAVEVMEFNETGWGLVAYNDNLGYVFAEFVVPEEEYVEPAVPSAELVEWSEAKDIFTIGVAAEVYDVRSGLTYQVKSFSNGNHADVEPVTEQDTATMKQTYGGAWSWDTRPVIVTINGRSLAASINGMPHGGGVNGSNGMNGQVCIHFKGSTTHNGNRSHEADHQRCVMEAYNFGK